MRTCVVVWVFTGATSARALAQGRFDVGISQVALQICKTGTSMPQDRVSEPVGCSAALNYSAWSALLMPDVWALCGMYSQIHISAATHARLQWR